MALPDSHSTVMCFEANPDEVNSDISTSLFKGGSNNVMHLYVVTFGECSSLLRH
jgi:hypothetical protein